MQNADLPYFCNFQNSYFFNIEHFLFLELTDIFSLMFLVHEKPLRSTKAMCLCLQVFSRTGSMVLNAFLKGASSY